MLAAYGLCPNTAVFQDMTCPPPCDRMRGCTARLVKGMTLQGFDVAFELLSFLGTPQYGDLNKSCKVDTATRR